MPAWSRPERVDDRWVLRSPKSGVVVAHLIDAGLDAINPVQITCAEMDAAGLKRDFGRDLTFWGGGGDTRDILPLGSPEKIR